MINKNYITMAKHTFAYVLLVVSGFGLIGGWWVSAKAGLDSIECRACIRETEWVRRDINTLRERTVRIEYLLKRAYLNLPELQEDGEWEEWTTDYVPY